MKLRCLVSLLTVLCIGCPEEKPPIPVVVGAKSTTEQRILGEILAQTIESYGMVAERKFDLGGTTKCDEALRAGKIDLYPEYTGLALITIIRSPASATIVAEGASSVLARVRAEYASKGLVWTSPFGFNNTYALMVHKGTAAISISEAVGPAHNWRAAFDFDFEQRVNFYPALKREYGLEFSEIRKVDPEQGYKPLLDRQVDIVVGNVTDAAISIHGLRALTDDREVLPPFEATPVVRRAALEQHPDLEVALHSLRKVLDVQTMRGMNDAVEKSGRSAAEVAAEFLNTL